MNFLKLGIAVACLFSAAAQAAPIAGLYDTGVDAGGQKIANAGVMDNHYNWTVILGGAATGGGAISPGTYPAYAAVGGAYIPATGSANGASGHWIPAGASPDSNWLTPYADPAVTFDPSRDGHYVFSTTFSINAQQFDVASASLYGRWASDNYGTMYLNNHLIATIANPRPNNPDGAAYNQWSSFAAVSGSSYFVAGTNTLTFDLTNIGQNGGNPVGLRAEFTSSISAVPEPESYAMLLAGLCVVGAMVRRRKPG
jgi:hypothetical protein